MYDYNYGYADLSTGGDALGIFGALAAYIGVISIIALVAGIISLISFWKVYKKAGKKGWESIIPIYNIIVLLQIVELPTWYIVLFIVPIANIYAMFKIYIELAHKFGKSTGFGVATVFFSIICIPILAFSKNSVYVGGNTNAVQLNNTMQPHPNDLFNQQPTGINNINNSPTNQAGPMMFNQNINTEINPINTVPNVDTNINTINPVQEQPMTQPINIIPQNVPVEPTQNINIQPMQPEVPTVNVDNNQSFMYNPNPTAVPNPSSQPMPEQTNFTQQSNNMQQVNVIPNMGPTLQPTMQPQDSNSNPNNTIM